jgi:predicted permease
MGAQILFSLVPVFALILLGYLVGRADLLGQRAFEVLNRFVLVLTLPVLTFRTIAVMHPGDLAQPGMIAAVLGGALGIYALAFITERLLGRNASDANVVAMSAGYSNTAFVGLPIAVLLFGQAAIPPTAVAIALNAAVVFTVGVLVADLVATQSSAWQGGVLALKAVSRNPPILSGIGGALWASLGMSLGGPLDVTLQTLGAATAPCALTAIGLFIARPRPPASAAVTARIALLKLIGQPLLTMGCLALLPPIPPLWAKVAVLMGAMPTGTSSFILAGGAGRWAMETSARAIVITTITASVTLSAVVWLF